MDISEIKSYDWGNAKSPWIGADPTLWKLLTDSRQVRKFAAGETLYFQGDNFQYAYIVSDGRVRVSVNSKDARQKQMYIACAGAIVGEVSCILSLPHIMEAVAIVPSRVYCIPSKELQRMFHSDLLLADYLLQYEARKNYMLIAQQASLSFDSAEVRIAKILLCLSDTYGVREKNGLQLSIRVTCEDIANIVGVSRVTANNILMDFRRQGILAKEEGRYHIWEPGLLESIAEDSFGLSEP